MQIYGNKPKKLNYGRHICIIQLIIYIIVSDHIMTIGEALCLLHIYREEVHHSIPGIERVSRRLADLYQNLKGFEG